ncbi:3-oxoacyl-ACP reductase [Pediococcus argentinicus]|uniref:3-ketoacyl-(Acyl-carrier-protein) reductase n=1 Tax=Pediococcus argentinicus TaxID=480391 RepID=A0A0R2NK52_9LACO|nr:3-oxoacyl-ACP reductase [Pediococcus argentinicus]KRO25234.1 3-ketoacyl-(acyl-carrier-protein) reductase [Pediococcus argentinicus]NKZ22369.1 3-oxoacyl-ACP reductase [Pediococcus argentinicus]GEP19494.1 NAD(P)-dependent dehydrogenase [Pediococcus argentinicus]
MTSSNWQNEIIYITGGNSGIGLAQTTEFLQLDATVIVFDISDTNLKLLASNYNNLNFFVADVSHPEEFTNQLENAEKKFGAATILCNTAGILDQYRPLLETDLDDWQKFLNTNLTSIFTACRFVLPEMLNQQHGVILNMASIAGLVAGGGGIAYTSAKHAIVGFTKQLDFEYANQGIRVNAIALGAIDTPMNQADFADDAKMAKWVAKETPAQRWGQASEVAKLSRFLVSPESDYIHGTIVPIDGGWTAK